jgi:activator of 2-hydroxyglutaryl-CoA dehydratase
MTAHEPEARGATLSGAWVCGIDIGASATKLVLLDDALALRASVVRHSGVAW